MDKLREKIASKYWLATTLMAQSIKSGTIDLSLTEDGFDELMPNKKMPYYNFADQILALIEEEVERRLMSEESVKQMMDSVFRRVGEEAKEEERERILQYMVGEAHGKSLDFKAVALGLVLGIKQKGDFSERGFKGEK